MPPLAIQKSGLYDLLASGVVDFIDLGAGNGASYEYVRRTTGLKVGVSLDLIPDKVTECRRVNDLSFVYDIREVPYSFGAVSATFMLNVLQQLPSEKSVLQVVQNALVASRDYVVIRQPFFDHDAALAGLGYRSYWGDWSEHLSRMDLPFLTGLARRCGPFAERLRVFGIDPIGNSTSPFILPLSAPPEQDRYDAALHGDKTEMAFDFPSYREVLVIIERQSIGTEAAASIARMLGGLGKRCKLLEEVGEPVPA